MPKKVTTIVVTGRPIRSASNAPNGNAGMISQLAKLTIAPAEVSFIPFETRISGPKLSVKINATLYRHQTDPLRTTPKSS